MRYIWYVVEMRYIWYVVEMRYIYGIRCYRDEVYMVCCRDEVFGHISRVSRCLGRVRSAGRLKINANVHNNKLNELIVIVVVYLFATGCTCVVTSG
jgi:hypothetical protein